MSERLPYEDQLAKQWDDLPLPDENMAWADMKRRLDEDDDKPLLPFWLRGCAGWGLLGILLLGLGWFILRPERWFTHKTKNESSSVNGKTGTGNEKRKDSTFVLNDSGRFSDTDSTTAKINNVAGDTLKLNLSIGAREVNTKDNKDGPVATNNRHPQTEVDNTIMAIDNGNGNIKKKKQHRQEDAVNTQTGGGVTKVKNKKSKDRQPVVNADSCSAKKPIDNAESNKPQTGEPATFNPEGTRDTVNKNNYIAGRTDTNINKTRTSVYTSTPTILPGEIVKKEKSSLKPEKGKTKDSSNKKAIEWSAGIGLQQQLPIAGQKWTPYNSQGRKGTLADYIPSVYLRLTRPQKWFVQAEFRYGAPQYNKELEYKQTTVSDTGSAPRFYYRNSSTLKKTYYHQLPVVFHYYIRPGWSVGAGIQWNSFYGAVAESELLYHNNILGTDTVFSKVIQPVKKDTASEFKKSFMQGVVETQYKWKRFSFGARYTFGLQPYIEFALPGAAVQKEKMNSLQLFIRFELWRQKRK
jgi:hypothetical protein